MWEEKVSVEVTVITLLRKTSLINLKKFSYLERSYDLHSIYTFVCACVCVCVCVTSLFSTAGKKQCKIWAMKLTETTIAILRSIHWIGNKIFLLWYIIFIITITTANIKICMCVLALHVCLMFGVSDVCNAQLLMPVLGYPFSPRKGSECFMRKLVIGTKLTVPTDLSERHVWLIQTILSFAF